ncbi:MAG: transcriptional repressor [Tissierellia bacterium]|jgi:Fur family ferric uptake transcriptional regulator|nr:Fur family transcriptional regulator [Bacillota bacterium]NLK58523.1 transcriptional repressor [Tissierellia bacterium]
MNLDEMRSLLTENGYKNTTQRNGMFLALEKHAGDHLSPEQLHSVLAEEGNHVGIATIYRTLQIFESLGIVHKLDFDDRAYRYEIVNQDEAHMHHHLICERCEKVTELHVDLLDKLEAIVEKDYGFTITDHAVKIFGICKACGEKQEETLE